jgi:hypothetical protein
LFTSSFLCWHFSHNLWFSLILLWFYIPKIKNIKIKNNIKNSNYITDKKRENQK